MKACRVFLLVAMLCFLPGIRQAHAEDVVSLTSLNWPPYTGFYLPAQGMTTHVVRSALNYADLELSVDFFPWKRSMSLASREGTYLGYFPEYPGEERRPGFLFSDSVGTSELGFVERVDDPVQWKSLPDLRDRLIGVVSGYINTPEFDSMARKGLIRIDPASSDSLNILKVASGRVDMAVMDREVFKYLLQSEPELAEVSHLVRFNEKLLGRLTLHVCFRKRPGAQELLRRFNAGLRKVDRQEIQSRYLRQVMP